MNALIAVLLITIGTAAALDGPDVIKAGSAVQAQDQYGHADTKRMEDKLRDALQGLEATDAPKDKGSPNAGENLSALNASALNASNSTFHNSTLESLPSLPFPGRSAVSGISSISPDDVRSDTQGSFKGFWGMESNKRSFGGSRIHSKTMLSGNFDVDKTVKFSE